MSVQFVKGERCEPRPGQRGTALFAVVPIAILMMSLMVAFVGRTVETSRANVADADSFRVRAAAQNAAALAIADIWGDFEAIAEGQPQLWRLRAHLLGQGLSDQSEVQDRKGTDYIENVGLARNEDGRFELDGVEIERLAVHRVDNWDSTDIVIEVDAVTRRGQLGLANERLAEVQVRVQVPDGVEASYLEFLGMELPPGTPAEPLGGPYSSLARRSTAGLGELPGFRDASGSQLPPHVVQHSCADGQLEATLRLAPGPVTIAVAGRPLGEGRQRFATVATGAVLVPAGRSTVSLKVQPLVGVSGRVLEETGEAVQGLGLMVYAAGDSVPLDAGRGPEGFSSSIVWPSQLGAFEFQVPAGDYHVSIGTEEELRAGRPRRTQRLKVPASGLRSVQWK